MTSKQNFLVISAVCFAATIVLQATHTRLSTAAAAAVVAREADAASAGDPTSRVWDDAGGACVALSSSGSGLVRSARVRALSDGEKLYVLLEWPDESPDLSFKGPYANVERGEVMRDAVQLAFSAGKVEPIPTFELAGAVGSVALWQWSSHWQRAVETSAAGVIGERIPDQIADEYPFEGNPLYYPARAAGNENAREPRQGPTESKIAKADQAPKPHPNAQLVARGVWASGWWRVLFVRPLAPPGDPAPIFSGNRTTLTVTLWDGGQADRGGSRAISTSIPLYAKVPVAANAMRMVRAIPTGGLFEWR